MALTKVALRTFVPGRAPVAYRAEQVICTPDPPTGGPTAPIGRWVQVCTTVEIFLGYDYGPAGFGNPGPFPKPIYVSALVCRSEWRPG